MSRVTLICSMDMESNFKKNLENEILKYLKVNNCDESSLRRAYAFDKIFLNLKRKILNPKRCYCITVLY